MKKKPMPAPNLATTVAPGEEATPQALATLWAQTQGWARELGFSQIGVSDVDLGAHEPGLLAWLAQGFHGQMDYMQRHGLRRARPAELLPGTVSVVSVSMNYLSPKLPSAWREHELGRLHEPQAAVVSLYARGRDYHKLMRQRLQSLAIQMQQSFGALGHRVFVDSAPVLEVALATRAGLGWRGKHTLALRRDAGSMFFLGEIFLDCALPSTPAVSDHCGACSACISVCPTQAIVAPYRLDARRCISYLTIEHAGAIPLELRTLMGNRIYGCDDCQLVCPWNKFAQRSALPDFDERQGLGAASLVQLMAWTEGEFLRFTEGSAIRRIGHERWQRNLAVAMGNALRQSFDASIARALATAREGAGSLVGEHIDWALAAH
jgi:epoxyqueuosine reductase